MAAVDLVISTRWRALWGWRSPSRCRRCRCRSGRNRTAAGCTRTTSGTSQRWVARRLDRGHLPRVVRRLRPQRLHPQPPRRPPGHRGLPRRRRGLRRGRRLVGDRHPARRARMRGLSTSNELNTCRRRAGRGPRGDPRLAARHGWRRWPPAVRGPPRTTAGSYYCRFAALLHPAPSRRPPSLTLGTRLLSKLRVDGESMRRPPHPPPGATVQTCVARPGSKGASETPRGSAVRTARYGGR